MSLHVGIVGCSSEGAALCYRTLCVEADARMGPYAHPEVTIHTPPLSAYVDCLARRDRQGVADLMLASGAKLAAAGADFLICPDNTIHWAFDLVEPHSPLPWLHIVDCVADEAERRGFAMLGLTGTRWLVENAVYPDRLGPRGIECLSPDEEAVAEVDRIIMQELVKGIVRPEATDYLSRVVGDLRARGADAVVLGCTELPLVLDETRAALPLLDSTRLLARAAITRALA